jgi:hypothetical protein
MHAMPLSMPARAHAGAGGRLVRTSEGAMAGSMCQC